MQSENTVILRPADGSIVHSRNQLESILEHLDMEDTIETLMLQNDESDYMWNFAGFASVEVRYSTVVDPDMFGCDLPAWASGLKLSKYVKLFAKKYGNKQFLPRNQCAFRAIFYLLQDRAKVDAMERNELDRYVEAGGQELAQQFAKFRNITGSVGPLQTLDFPDLENLFHIQLDVWRLDLVDKQYELAEDSSKLQKSKAKRTQACRVRHRGLGLNLNWPEVNICLIGNHIGAIVDMKRFTKVFFCSDCGRRFGTASECKRHQERTKRLCNRKVVKPAKTAWYNVQPSLGAELLAWGVTLPVDFETFNLYGTFDCETYKCEPEEKPVGKPDQKLFYVGMMRLVSMAYGCNIEGIKPQVHVNTNDWIALVEGFVDYVEYANQQAQLIYTKKYEDIFKQLEEKETEIKKGNGYNPFPDLRKRLMNRMSPIKFYGW